MKYHLITYGCQMNIADSEEMAQPLKSRGFVPTPDIGQADVVMMNTCTVREQAEHKADSNIGRLREWKAANPERILIVAGCAATRWGDSIKKKYPFIDAVSPATKIEQFPELISKVLKERWDWEAETEIGFNPNVGAPREPLQSESDPEREGRLARRPYEIPDGNWFGSQSTAYITIMRGCNYSCSYCIVPSVRGREKYRALPEILDEIRQKVAEGYREVMLLGQTVNSYHWRADGSMDFADLLRAVNAVDGVETIRFMSPHPKHMKERTIQAIHDCAKIANHVHLPLQSGSDPMLARMKRLYTGAEYLDIVSWLRAARPGIEITTDIIVGFPGETETDFEQTLTLLRAARFNSLFAFKYSPRPGTVSAEWPDDVPLAEKESRLQRILAFTPAAKA